MLFVYKSQYSYRILRLVFAFQLPQGLAELEAEQEHRAGDGDGIGHGLRQEHGPGLVRQQVGQQIDQRQQQHDFRSTATMMEQGALPMDTKVIWQAIWMPIRNRAPQ